MHPDLPSASPSTNRTCYVSNIICSVCGDQADGQHFGAIACRACAAFFRRTIARNLQYVCGMGRNCVINKAVQKNRNISSKRPPNTAKQQLTGECPSLLSPTAKVTAQPYCPNSVLLVEDECTSTTHFPPLSSKKVNIERQEIIYKRGSNQLHQQHLTQNEVVNSRDQHKAEVVRELLRLCSMKLLKQFWIQFLILERCYDTFKVVPDKLDSRLAFPEGIIVDTLNGASMCRA
uniref:Nuclear receptor domain-containing protein n=1 Tax=Ditylenchus dipsaci TaxID=166011 RepID=A0A915E4V1_9BILA